MTNRELLDDLGISEAALNGLLPKGAAYWPPTLLAYALETVDGLQGVYWFAHGTADAHKIERRTWWRAFILAARDTALTRPRICSIHRRQIAPNGVAVVGDGEAQRIVRFKRDTKTAMLDRQRPFEWPHDPTKFWREWKAICREAGLPKKLVVCPMNTSTIAAIAVGDDHAAAVDTTTAPKTLRDFFERFYVPLRLRGKAKRTVVLYDYSVRSFGHWLGRDALLSDFTDLTVANYLASLTERKKPLSPYSVEKERNQLLAMWRLANGYHFVALPPNVPPTKLPRHDPICWTEQQLQQLFEAAKHERGTYSGVPAADWWTALLMVMWDTGERIDPLLAIGWDRFDLKDRWVTIPAELRKGKTTDLTHRLHPDTIAALKAIRQPIRDVVFPWPKHRSYLWRIYGLILSAAHLPSDRKRKFHCIRRSVASHFEAAGGNATALLGHSSRAVTEKSYLDPRIVPQQQAADVLFRPYGADTGTR